MKVPLVVIVLLIVACGPQTAGKSPNASAGRTTAPTPTQSTPTPTPALAASYAVVVKDFLVQGGPTYTLSIVSSNGQVAAKTTARRRTTPLVQIGNLSTSATAVYYLDGDSDVHFLRPDGSTGLATKITMAGKHAAAFAVSPDDQRIAVSVLDYTRYPVGTRLYVEDLNGGGNHIELFSSATVLEWPVGWHAGRLVMGLGINSPPQNFWDGFTQAHGYHIADAKTGNRLLSLCTGADGFRPESSAGTVCVSYPNATAVSWDGSTRALPKSAACPMVGPLSPAGDVATNVDGAGGGCGGGPKIYIVTARGEVDPRNVVKNAQPMGWIDADHLVVTPTSSVSATPPLSIVVVSTGASSPVQATGFLAAALPGGL